MPRIGENAREEWLLFDFIYSIFERNLPRLRTPSNDTDTAKLKIDLVRKKTNQYMTKRDFRRFLDALKTLLDIFERFVDKDLFNEAVKSSSELEAPKLIKTQSEIDVDSRYPRLAALKRALEISELVQPSTLLTQSLLKFEQKIPSDFKLSEYTVVDAGICSLNAIIDDLFGKARREDINSRRLHSFKDEEIVAIQDAEQCRSSFNSLFQLLVGNLPCRASHSAWVHMSGFRRRELDIVIIACNNQEQQQKRTVTCRRCRQMPSDNPSLEAGISCHFNSQRHSQVSFNDHGLWSDAQLLLSAGNTHGTRATCTDISLRELLDAGGVQNQLGELCEFEREDQKLVVLLLAHSLLFLGRTFWLQSCVDMDQIKSFPWPDSDNALDRWRLHLPCDLHINPPSAHDQIEQVHQFGIFLLEMETGLKAHSLPVEVDYENPKGSPGKDIILETMLAEWARKVDDGYLQVAKACLHYRESAALMFQSLDEHRPKLVDAVELKDAATILKRIILPLEKLLADRYATAFQLFPDFTFNARQSIEEEFNFYDDILFTQGSPEARKLVTRANVFLKGMKGSVTDIEDITMSCQSQLCVPEPVKIAILDTGIDKNDAIIKKYLDEKRIMCSKGFAADPADVQDNDGHGTHVVKILIKHAPAAEFYIAKISNKTKIPAEQLRQVARAIEWALVKKNVDILSMSFGWHRRNKDINLALGKAQHHQVMFAAASNDGARGHSEPTFPAQNLRVFCINACDGLGNPADFNPPAKKGNSFMTLGLGITSYWKTKEVYKSGTSFATPMAVAMVANALEFTRHKCGSVPLSDDDRVFFHSGDGVRLLMQLMTKETKDLEIPHGYSFMDPSRIWDGKRDRSDIADMFKNAL